jgi:hypothetical protein
VAHAFVVVSPAAIVSITQLALTVLALVTSRHCEFSTRAGNENQVKGSGLDASFFPKLIWHLSSSYLQIANCEGLLVLSYRRGTASALKKFV